jgi:hypothetical protein
MHWLLLLAGLIPLPRPDANEARILLLRAELKGIDSPGLAQFDQAAMVFMHTSKSVTPLEEPRLGGCRAGTAPPEQVQGYFAGAAPMLASQVQGEGIRLEAAPQVSNGRMVRSVSALSGAAGVYAATIGGSRRGVASEMPLFFGRVPASLRIEGQDYSVASPRLFQWRQREEALQVRLGASLRLQWSQASDGEMLIVVAAAEAQRRSHWIVCRQSASRSEFQVPARLLSSIARTDSATLLLLWKAADAWQKIQIPRFGQAWAASAHIQGARLALLR